MNLPRPARRDEPPPSGRVSRVGSGKSAAMESTRVRPASGIGRRRRVITRNLGKGRCLRRGTFCPDVDEMVFYVGDDDGSWVAVWCFPGHTTLPAA